ncbi:MAG: acyl CoA:acetate/3-ketoacid CoA transferase [Clostridiales Family XIII bacterium]|jgi:propionate CoA-transferase|nr:acyl CoA:acetate/3-ketoacid CoA transferase [Clostridiales Family XIII bacterium]
MKNKVMSVRDAAALVKDGDTVAISSAGLIGYPEYLSIGLAERFDETGHPKDLTISAGCGHAIPVNPVWGDAKFGKPGMMRRYIASHPMTAAPVMDRIVNEEIEGYCLPQGILNQLYRASAAKQPGLLSKIGMGTYIDPRQEGGKLNARSKEDMVKLMEIDGEEWLFYKSYPVHVAMIRATTADEDGNLSIEEEALKLEIMEIALAAKAQNGVVIAQVKHLAANGALKPRDVVVPGELVDAVVVAELPEENHRQTKGTYYSPYLSGQLKKPAGAAGRPGETLSAEDVVCRRAVMELYPGCIVNIGLGIGAGIGAVAEIEGFLDKMTFTLELGSFGGVPTPISDFGAAICPTSFLSHPSMFDYYHGGNLDIAFLGTAETDRAGNVNVSKMGGRNAGQGGFIDISTTSKKTVFVSFFTAKGLKTSIADGKLKIDREGAVPKLVEHVAQITYNGSIALADGREAVYITERAVFKLTKDGLMLTEIAPGADLEKDILAHMEFKPLISDKVKLMDERIFVPGRMGCFDLS